MILQELLEDISYEAQNLNLLIDIEDIQFDSRKIKKNNLFIAQKGVHIDGHTYINRAIELGAVAIICEQYPQELIKDICYIKCGDSSAALGIVASNFFGRPSNKLKLIGVTGTNGKTSTATLLYQLMLLLDKKSGLLSTVCNYVDTNCESATHTTPDAIAINHYLQRMVDAGCEYCFMEVSSHAIDQKRISGLHFKGGVFTNITHDHLDYHKTFKSYIAAKQQFFTHLGEDAFALTNIDDKNGMIMVQNSKAAIYTYSCKTMADYHCKSIEKHMDGTLLLLDDKEVWTHFTGDFNMYNLLAVYGTARLLGFSKYQLLLPISKLRPVAGRFDTVMSSEGVLAVIDYAHTPDAVENVLRTINEIKEIGKRVITVVGAGGDRDKTKRPEMARSASNLSDIVILTSDNPRSEEPQSILDDMLAGVIGESNIIVEVDRKEAIKHAVALANKGDVVLIAGKGHENYQEIKGVKYHFDDKEMICAIFNK